MRGNTGRQHRHGKRKGWRLLAVLLTLAIGVAACTGGGGGETVDTEAVNAAGDSSGRQLIRFLFAPDPVWDYLKDTGTLAAWEDEHNVRVVDTDSWDEFQYFARGHGDIISTGTYEVPLLERETDTETVTFGRYNHVRNIPLVRPDSGYETFQDLPDGARIAGSSTVGSALVWGMLLAKLDGRVVSPTSTDFDQVVAENEDMPNMVAEGEIDVCWCNPEAAVSRLRDGDLVPMYSGRNAQELYREATGTDHHGLMSNVFTSTAQWYDENPELARAFVELWQEGVDLWNQNLEEIVGIYPQHFDVETEADTDWVADYLLERDWFVDEVALTPEWIAGETQMYDVMKETGFMEQSEEVPRFEVVPSG